MRNIFTVVAMVPVFNEPQEMIISFWAKFAEVVRRLKCQSNFQLNPQLYFLSDGAVNLPDNMPCLNGRRKENWRLARTLMEGYGLVLKLDPVPDLIIRLDVQEHDPGLIPQIIDHFEHSPVEALFLPVIYEVEGQPRPLMAKVTRDMAEFQAALNPIDQKTILRIYNQKFPLGFQCYSCQALERIFPQLERGLEIFRQKYGPPSWGLDLLAILLAAKNFPEAVDFFFGGWMTPYKENITSEKVAVQRLRAVTMVEIAIELGCPVKN